MMVQLSPYFEARITAVSPERTGRSGDLPHILLVSRRGAVVEKTVVDSWAKGTFKSPVDSLEYHFGKHGRGRTRQQYTYDALRFFVENQEHAEWGRWNPAWNEAFRLKIGAQCGYFTPGGRILSFWDEHDDSREAL